jgi:hypothetical protein
MDVQKYEIIFATVDKDFLRVSASVNLYCIKIELLKMYSQGTSL